LEGETDRKRTDQSFFVPVYEIRENDYDLSINRYREVEYKEVHYDEPKVILDRVKRLEKEISDGIDELSKMID
jgi:type I restriction enzyme M protein